MQPSTSLDSDSSPMHKAWRRDRLRRHRLPFNESWRGCVGLAMLWHNVDDAECHGSKIFYDNRNLYWACLRDVPAGHFPGNAAMNHRNVLYGSLGTGRLWHGMPCLDFSTATRSAWDLARPPYDTATTRKSRRTRPKVLEDVLDSAEHPREFAVFTQLSTAMTDFAAHARNPAGRPLRPLWARALGHSMRIHFPPIGRFFPEPYLGFEVAKVDQLYHAVTNRFVVEAAAYPCRYCGALIEPERLRFGLVFDSSGRATGPCPRCRRTSCWNIDDAITGRSGRWFNSAFRSGFCAAVGRGLPLRAIERMHYQGVSGKPGRPAAGLDLLRHRLSSMANGAQMIIHLPRFASVLATPGDVLEPGEVWCHAIPIPPRRWQSLNPHQKWTQLGEVCGATQYIGLLQQIWFDGQAVRLARDPGLAFYPAALVAGAVREIPPRKLVWETDRVGSVIDPHVEAAIFPPVPTGRWDRLRFAVGDVAVNAEVGDPRFSLTCGRTPAYGIPPLLQLA